MSVCRTPVLVLLSPWPAFLPVLMGYIHSQVLKIDMDDHRTHGFLFGFYQEAQRVRFITADAVYNCECELSCRHSSRPNVGNANTSLNKNSAF